MFASLSAFVVMIKLQGEITVFGLKLCSTPSSPKQNKMTETAVSLPQSQIQTLLFC